jgi:uncharacterized membrane protein YdjX (TVP38/TMEM64 family)
MGELIGRYRWPILIGGSALFLGFCVWFFMSETSGLSYFTRLYQDKRLLKQTLNEWGILAPVFFILLQALQVVFSPIPGEATGFLGGFLFGIWGGFIYSTIGLTLGSMGAFAIGRWLGAHFVRKVVSKETWARLGFIVEAEGAILCFIIYLIPGLPKDIVCYLFGISPMPLWVFALVSGLGRMPGTWILSAQGAQIAAGHYVQVVLLTAIVVAIALPLYYYRHQILEWMRRRSGRGGA